MCGMLMNVKHSNLPLLMVFQALRVPMYLDHLPTLMFKPYEQLHIRCFRATGENGHVSEVSWELGPKVSLPKTEKSVD